MFRQVVGTTLGRYLSECRVALAQLLLLGTDLPVTELAIRSGSTSSSRFFAVFGDVCGVSPGAYRKRAGGCTGAAVRGWSHELTQS